MNHLFNIELFPFHKTSAAAKYSLFPAFFSLASDLLKGTVYLQGRNPAAAARSAAYFQKG